ncbi:MAG: ribonuclease P protein subunit [Candidatus Methanomethyliaceae archaeon]|nr:ribonuclease P protein subunit [Candidatus Methanomethyliaceae archaeon]MDW7970345.1 ribonuclease P protein subunit [Nitrososphaerota archaeon]
MKHNPSNLIYHNLVGLNIEVTSSTDPTQIGVRGIVVDETANLLIISTMDNKVKKIPKRNCIFTFFIPNPIVVRGEEIAYNPAERLKRIKRGK